MQLRQFHSAIVPNTFEIGRYFNKPDAEGAYGRPVVEYLISQELARGIWLQLI